MRLISSSSNSSSISSSSSSNNSISSRIVVVVEKTGVVLKSMSAQPILIHIYFVQAKDYMANSELNNLVRPTIDYLQGIHFPSGNFPSSLGNNSDKLVHWCHGAPGTVFLFAQAYKESMPGN